MLSNPGLLVVILSVLLTSCGRSVIEKNIKDYRLTIVDGDNTLASEFKRLIQAFNDGAGFEALKYEPDPELANSAIVLTPNLYAKSEKVGFGQWITETEEKVGIGPDGSQVVTRVRRYSMRVEFDADYFSTRSFLSTDTVGWFELRKLFFHEIGHGLEMGHANEPSNVMYLEIGGQKDFDQYFSRVQSYFGRE